MLLRIILLPSLTRFSLICRMWAFPITHVIGLWGERTGLLVLSWRQGLGYVVGLASFLGLASGPACLFFKPHKIIIFKGDVKKNCSEFERSHRDPWEVLDLEKSFQIQSFDKTGTKAKI